MTQNALVIPEGSLPAHVLNKDAKIHDAALTDGISTGAPPSIVLKGTRFALKSEGEERIVDATTIKIIILAGRAGLYKAWYATNYDPNQAEGKAPDCHSKDGIKPDADSTMKQAESCAGCPMNQFGTGRNERGEVTKGKSCADNKIIAAFHDGRAWQLKIPPSSLRAFGDYVRQLNNHDINSSRVITIVGFNPQVSHPQLTFAYGGFLPETIIPKIDEMIASDEVDNIINPVYVTATTEGKQGTAVAAPAPEPEPEIVQTAAPQDAMAELMGTETAAPVQQAPVQQAPVQQAPVQQAPVQAQPEVEVVTAAQLDPTAASAPAEVDPTATVAAASNVETTAVEVQEAPGQELDADTAGLADELGLDI